MVSNAKQLAHKRPPNQALLARVRPTSASSAEAPSNCILASKVTFRDGDFSVRLPSDWEGVDGQIAAAFNQTVSHEDRLRREVSRLRGAIGGQAVVPGVRARGRILPTP
jgi:hypothetical protein